jgi:hypothetical protein
MGSTGIGILSKRVKFGKSFKNYRVINSITKKTEKWCPLEHTSSNSVKKVKDVRKKRDALQPSLEACRL